MKTCPFCANEIQDAAIKSQFCQSMLSTAPAAPPASSPAPQATTTPDPSAEAPGPPVRRQRHPILQLLVLLGVLYFVGAAGLDAFQGRMVGVVVNLVCTVPFAFSAPYLWLLGDVFRNFAIPTWYFGSGAIDMVKQRLFWMIGPQTIGVAIGFGLLALLGIGASADEPDRPNSSEAHDAPAVTQMSPASTPAAATTPTAAAEPAVETLPTEQPSHYAKDGQSAGSIADLPSAEEALFAAYRVDMYTGPVTVPSMSKEPPAEAAAIKSAIEAGPNFAGRYALVAISCGDGCFVAITVDVDTSNTYALPRGGPNDPHFAIEFVKDSTLVRTRWASHIEAGGQVTSCAHEDFVLASDGFQSQGRTDLPGPCHE